MQYNKLCMENTKKYELYNNIVRCTYLSQENKMYHHNINVSTLGNLHLKLG